MSRILALTRYGRLGASSRVRTIQYQDCLRDHGLDVVVEALFGDDYIRALYSRRSRIPATLAAFRRRFAALRLVRDFDAVWVEKEALPWLPAAVELAALPGQVPLIVDYDDAVFHRYDRHRSAAVRRLLGRKIDAVMARADLVVAGNGYLADRARAAGACRVEVVPTVVDLDRYVPCRDPEPKPVTVGWIGSPSTAPYLDAVKPVIADLARSSGIAAVAVGARQDQVVGSPFVARRWREEAEVADLNAFDIGIMPLADTPWERGKCAYKLIQYMALGIPVVASPVGANREVVVHGENGLLAEDAGEWRTALVALAADPALRASMGRAGRRTVEQGYSLQLWAPRLAAMLHETIDVARKPHPEVAAKRPSKGEA